MRNTTAGAVWILLAVMVWALLSACGNVAGPLPQGPADMEGFVTRLSTDGLARPGLEAELMIEKDPSIPFEEWLRNPGPGSYERLPQTGRRTVPGIVRSVTLALHPLGESTG